MKNTHNSQERLEYLKQQLPSEITRAVADTLREDLGGTLDVTTDITASLIPADTQNVATIITREHGVFCGQMWLMKCLNSLAAKSALNGTCKMATRLNQTKCFAR
ncbi:quinolinate phosphoribosyltransferase [Vibrio maritimus]|uniref:Quinolinate phosphoribosyltransferase n=1 Tax=Vibrio maritimus TaxID=990268 RepID=A0A090TAI4_9VIBR|nr:quinolinate phosphoribosyltransferase [Vibrio maritimus]